jgi:hypothetical protein
MISWKFSIKLSLERAFLTIQDEFDKITDVVLEKVCF